MAPNSRLKPAGKGYLNISAIGTSALLFTLGSGAMWFVLPVMAEKAFGNLLIVGAIIAVPSLVSMIFDIPMGELSDRIGRRRIILAGLAVMFLLGFALSTLTTLAGFILFVVVLGFANLAIIVPARAYVMDITPKDKTSEFFGLFEAMTQVGFMVGPAAAGYLIGQDMQAGLISTGLFYSVACAFAAAALLFARETLNFTESVINGITVVVRTDRLYLKGLRDFSRLHKAGWGVLAATFIIVFIDGIVWAIEPLYMSEGISAAAVGIIMSMFVLPFILFEIPAGLLADRIGKATVLNAGLLTAGLSLMAFGISKDPQTMTVAAFASATGLAFARPAMDGILADLTAKNDRGSIVGVWDVSEDLAYVISPIVGGLVGQTFGIGATFVFAGCIPLIGLPLINRALKAG
jgi:DHA1 family multidrug resistance protein-like MFS transporter